MSASCLVRDRELTSVSASCPVRELSNRELVCRRVVLLPDGMPAVLLPGPTATQEARLLRKWTRRFIFLLLKALSLR